MKNQLLLLLILCVTGKVLFAQGTDFWGDPPQKPRPVPKVKTVPEPKPVPPEPKPEPVKPVIPEHISVSDVIFLMDVSGSMDAAIENQPQSKMESAQAALSYFAENMKEGTRFQLWTYSATLTQHPNSKAVQERNPGKTVFEPIGPFHSSARQHVGALIKHLKTEGGTNLYHALYEAIRYFQSSSSEQVDSAGDRYKVIVLLSDGQDDEISAIKLPHVLALKKQLPDIHIKTIGFGVRPKDPFYQVLCKLASDPDSCINATDTKELKDLIHKFTRS
ncbi:MAG: VWA domain-containing protein [SAR324 cluster bacterium]|nr:VWA domain-containing protein [SAR324 cluster bacterium]